MDGGSGPAGRLGALGLGRSAPVLLSAAAAVLYGGTAISMNFVNKATLQAYPQANAVLLLQMVGSIAVLYPLRACGAASFPPFSRDKARQLLPVTLLYVSNVAFALLGLQSLNIPMYNVLKRMTPVIVLSLKSAMTHTWPHRDISLSVLVTVAGCIVASLGDLSFDPRGYACALTSCCLQAGYLLLVEQSGAKRGVGTTELLMYNAVLSLPFITLVLLVTGEAWTMVPELAAATSRIGPWTLLPLLAAGAMAGMLLNFALFLNTMVNSALTTTIVGVLKGVVATVLGFFLLGGVDFHVLNVAGIAMNTAGGVWYTVIKYRQRQERTQGVHHKPHASDPQLAQVAEQTPLLPQSSHAKWRL